MTVELERKFYKWYKRINISCDEQQTTNRWEGIQNAIDLFESSINISELLKIYYRLSFDVSIKDQFVECFATEDKSFDETNEEEMVILAGGVLAQLLGQENNIFVAYSLLILDTYYEAPLKELSDMASSLISDMSKEIKKSEESSLDTIKKIDLKEVEEIISETSDLTEEGVDKLVTIIKSMNENMNILVQVLENENRKYQEDTGILSWIVGEWSDILEMPLMEVKKVNGAFVIGAELSDLVKLYPGPYAAKAFIKRMLDKCIDDVPEITLTEFIDRQDEKIRSFMVKKYGKGCDNRLLPIISAIKASLSVDEAKLWTPVYKKAWKINPDEIRFDLLTWSELMYRECMISTC
ncbi:hypothetical protein FYJ37_03065 [[Clostridium] scindens]|uniref:GTPase-associated system helical domain-containing protein n=1 Tax=Clostridium scindens (strain JCM 10418 / VPI 12708) TaxID=29347 RepID=A0A844F6P5_CLOSV|nr:GTPase-associated system all-helical protein GASH [[Clostridium] scindens]MDY5246911.1 GTPase-associated system all-helical protein GASH [Ligilactobacillus salivarius]MSS39360.1 hypothetical protein [[Clostridium] scindens]